MKLILIFVITIGVINSSSNDSKNFDNEINDGKMSHGRKVTPGVNIKRKIGKLLL